jgi:hypothetical protein
MWRWIRRWRDWAMNEIVTPHRIAAQPQSLYYSCEKGGLVLQNQPIPWGAESVLVEALLRLPPSARKKADFALRLPGRDPVPAETLRKDETADKYRLFFRLGPPPASTTGELFWRHHPLGKIDLPVLTADEFARDLRLVLPTVFVNVGGRNVAAQTFVASQYRGLTAAAVVRSPTGLAPLLDLGLRVVFRWERSGRCDEAPAQLSAAQLAGKEAMVAVSPPRLPKKAGEWQVSWQIGERVLAVQRVRAITTKAFLDSLRVADTRFVIQAAKGGLQVRRQLPTLDEVERAGPCFLLCSREPGMAGLVHLQVAAQVPGAVQPPAAADQKVLVTDGPTLVSPPLLDAAELAQLTAFELRHRKRTLGSLPLSPVPLAALSGEGGFKPPGDFLWNNVAEEELLERLSRLMDVDRGKGP